MICPDCKELLDTDSRFCKCCGARVDDTAAASSTRAALLQSASKKQSDVYHNPRNERPVWQGRPAWRSFYGTWGMWLVLSLVSLIASYRYAGPESALITVIWLFVLGAAVTLVAREMLIIYGLSYRMTTQRLFVYRGIFTRVTDQLELFRINDVRLRQGLVDRLVHTGDLEIFGTDETDNDIILKSISDPEEVAETLRLHVRTARSKATLAVEQI